MSKRYSNAHRAKLRIQWTPERREEQRQAARQRWRDANPERAAVQDAIAAAIADGTLSPEPCDTCGGEGRPTPDYDTGAVTGWRCQACWDIRKAVERRAADRSAAR